MTAPIPFSYVQARAQARLAGLPRESDWQRLEATRGLSAFLEEARGTALKGWVVGLSGASNAHDIDRGIRAVYRTEIETAARWVPDRWAPSVLWVQWLPHLQTIGEALRRGRAPDWMASDPSLAAYLGAHGELDRAALQAAGLGPLVDAVAEGADPAEAWRDVWHRRWPRPTRAVRRNLEHLTAALLDHHRLFQAAAPDRTWPLRRELEQRLRHLFHVYLLQPAGLFVYLALVAVGLERLRAALVSRALFAGEVPR